MRRRSQRPPSSDGGPSIASDRPLDQYPVPSCGPRVNQGHRPEWGLQPTTKGPGCSAMPMLAHRFASPPKRPCRTRTSCSEFLVAAPPQVGPRAATGRNTPPQGDPRAETDRNAPPQGDPRAETDRNAPPQGDPRAETDRNAPPQGDPRAETDRNAPPQGDPRAATGRTARPKKRLRGFSHAQAFITFDARRKLSRSHVDCVGRWSNPLFDGRSNAGHSTVRHPPSSYWRKGRREMDP